MRVKFWHVQFFDHSTTISICTLSYLVPFRNNTKQSGFEFAYRERKIFYYKAKFFTNELKARFSLTTFAFNPFLLPLSSLFVSHALFSTPRGLTLHLPSSLVRAICFLIIGFQRFLATKIYMSQTRLFALGKLLLYSWALMSAYPK